MRELFIRIRFTTPCLGNEKKYCRDSKTGKRRYHFLFQRSPNGKVIFLPTWWCAILIKAAELYARHQKAVKSIRFDCEIDGRPADGLFTRFYEKDKFTKHEVFDAGTVVGFSCLVPGEIEDEDFQRLLNLAGKYYGISPARPNEFGFFEVESVRRSSLGRRRNVESKEREGES